MKDKIQQAFCIVLYAVAIYLWAANSFWYLFVGIVLLHSIELFTKSWEIGKRAGKSAFETIVMTLLFGFTWWLPLEKSLTNKNGEEKNYV